MRRPTPRHSPALFTTNTACTHLACKTFRIATASKFFLFGEMDNSERCKGPVRGEDQSPTCFLLVEMGSWEKLEPWGQLPSSHSQPQPLPTHIQGQLRLSK